MHSIHDTVTRKFVESIKLENLEIETDSGWQPVSSIHQTVPYEVWVLKTSSGKYLEAADTHIVFDEHFNQIFVKDLIPNQSKIITSQGPDTIISLEKTTQIEPMFDLTIDSKDHRFFSNEILSHNTVIINALSYALYGQALTNIKRDNLINNINMRNMLVTLTFEKDDITYHIERGRRPAILKFFINNVEQEVAHDEAQGDSRETQKDLTAIIGMSHDLFKHIVALNTYTEPFLSMRAADQRMIIEQLLGITILSEKAEVLKKQIQVTKENILKETTNIESIKKSNEKIQQSINTLTTRQKLWNDQHRLYLEKLGRSIVDLENIDINEELEQHRVLKEYQTNLQQFNLLKKEKENIQNINKQSLTTIQKLTTDLEALQNKICHSCGQTLHEEKYIEMKVNKETQLKETILNNTELELKLSAVNQKLLEIDLKDKPITYYDTVELALTHQNNLKSLEEQLLIKSNENDPYQEQIVELTNTAIQDISWDQINTLDKTRNHQEFLLKLLTNKDSFIRKKIINQNLAYLNNRLTYYLDKINLPHDVTFQTDLTVQISHLGKDLDFDNLSRGERNRLIISLSFAFRDLWENEKCPINLLFIDEILDAGLDSSGVENAIAILKQITRERKKNIYLISHKDELIGRVNTVLKVIKTGGFTSFETDNESF
jgi:energy-coupling factor transporter ATP-binding protein EcfA2